MTLGTLLVPFYFIKVGEPFSGNPGDVLEDAIDAFVQLSNNWLIICAVTGTIISIAFFNFAGISVTKEISATTRMVLDSVRTMVIWLISLLIGWQKFQALQLVGFVILLFGMCLYNDVFICQAYHRVRDRFVQRRYGNVVNESNIIVNRPADDTQNP